MRPSAGRRAAVVLRALVLLTLVALAPASGQARVLARVDARLGFDGVLRPDAVNPVVVRIANLGEAARFEIDVRSAVGGLVSSSADAVRMTSTIELASDERRTLRLAVPVGRALIPIELVVRASGAEIHREELRPTTVHVEGALVVGIGDARLVPEVRASRVVWPVPDLLPGGWAAWDAADLLVVADPPAARIGAAEQGAVRRWLFNGGELLVVRGPDGAPASEEVRRVLGAIDTTGVPDRGGPAVESWFYGAGRIHLLDQTQLNDEGYRATLAGLYDAALFRAPEPIPVSAERRIVPDATNPVVPPDRLYRRPGRLLALIAIAIAVLGIVPLVRGGWRPWPAMGAAIASTALLTLLFAGALAPPERRVLDVQLIRGRADDPVAILERDVLVMATRAGRVAVTLPVGEMPVAERERPLAVRTSGEALEAVVDVAEWRLQSLLTAGRVPLPITADLRGSAEAGSIALENRTDALVTDLILVFGDRIVALGPLSPRQRTTRSWDASTEDGLARVIPVQRSEVESIRRGLERAGAAAGAVLVASAEAVAPPLQVSGADASSWAVIEVALPLRDAAVGVGAAIAASGSAAPVADAAPGSAR